MNGQEIMQLLKVIHCNFTYDVGYRLFGVGKWPYKAEYDPIYSAIRKDLFAGMCQLDEENQNKLFEWAQSKVKPIA